MYRTALGMPMSWVLCGKVRRKARESLDSESYETDEASLGGSLAKRLFS